MKANTKTTTRQPRKATQAAPAGGPSAGALNATASALSGAVETVGDIRAGIRALWMAAADLDDRADERAFKFMTDALEAHVERVERHLDTARNCLGSLKHGATPNATDAADAH